LVSYLSGFTKAKIGIIIGVLGLSDIFNEKYYLSLKGGILEAFATLFSRNVKMYAYPAKDLATGEIKTCKNFQLPANLVDLYEYLIANDKIEDIHKFQQEYLSIISDKVLDMIKKGEQGWETFVPEQVASSIKDKKLFSYNSPQPA
jgi:hypothetical protein